MGGAVGGPWVVLKYGFQKRLQMGGKQSQRISTMELSIVSWSRKQKA